MKKILVVAGLAVCASLIAWQAYLFVTPSITTEELFYLTNLEREKHGIQPLILDERLNASAKDKCLDMKTKRYIGHKSPDGGHWSRFVDKHLKYNRAAENISYGYYTSQNVIDGFMSSPPHRAGLLDTRNTHVGFYTCYGSSFTLRGKTIHTVQHFAVPVE